MNLARVILLRGHMLALARCTGWHHGRRPERHQIGLVFCLVRYGAYGIRCVRPFADVQELARGRFPEQFERFASGTA